MILKTEKSEECSVCEDSDECFQVFQALEIQIEDYDLPKISWRIYMLDDTESVTISDFSEQGCNDLTDFWFCGVPL